eukprot:COSAG02_NODE_768_length_17375_cov_52.865015_5_plen_84_part_00
MLQDAFGRNDVYVVTTVGVAKDDMLKDDEGEPCGVVSNRLCPSGLGAFAVKLLNIHSSAMIADPSVSRNRSAHFQLRRSNSPS